ncbi:hypothetical protein [Streptomyces sp. KLOTTS4A1]|uniref:hypothetical protein n=1 Tax=Streptomyces sp. KLOTTS4A1 TaxID=3390996 RepID=UPI0039F56844
MFDQISAVQQIGLTVLLVVSVGWVVGLVRAIRRDRREIALREQKQREGAKPTRLGREGAKPTRPGCEGAKPVRLAAVPRQSAPQPCERVDLTAEEREAFAGLVSRLTDR